MSVKVNLLLDNPGGIRSGYINIDPAAPESSEDGRVRGHVTDISHTVDAAEADEIIALDILDVFPGHTADDILSNWLSRLSKGGKLTLSVVDVMEVANGIRANTLTPEEIQELLHGKQEGVWQVRQGAYTLAQLSTVLTNRGYKVLARRVQKYRAVITCMRVT